MACAVILPRKPSALLRIAVGDCKKVEAMPDRVLNMSVWHEPSRFDRAVCAVCMAGAVLDQTIQVPIAVTVDLFCDADQMPENRDQLIAINSLRLGSLDSACADLGIEEMANDDLVAGYEKAIRESFDDDAEHAPWSVYLEQADILEKAGL